MGHCQKLVLAGKMGEAISLTDKLYPGFLQLHPALHFMLKVRQFIEMVSGNDDAIVVGLGGVGNVADAVVDANDDNRDEVMANSNDNEDVVMNGKETNGNIASASSSPEEEIIETPSTTEGKPSH